MAIVSFFSDSDAADCRGTVTVVKGWARHLHTHTCTYRHAHPVGMPLRLLAWRSPESLGPHLPHFQVASVCMHGYDIQLWCVHVVWVHKCVVVWMFICR